MRLWIVAAVEQELSWLFHATDARLKGRVGGSRWFAGNMGNRAVYLGITGVGVAAAAMALGAFCGMVRPHLLVMVGSAGALPGSGLQTGDMVVSEVEILAELGVAAGIGIGDARDMKLLGVQQEVPLDRGESTLLWGCAAKRGRAVYGRSLTVLGVSGDDRQARERAVHFRTLAENMEGYAVALAGENFRCRTVEIRGISNAAGDRDKSRWDFEKAVLPPQKAVLEYLRETHCKS